MRQEVSASQSRERGGLEEQLPGAVGSRQESQEDQLDSTRGTIDTSHKLGTGGFSDVVHDSAPSTPADAADALRHAAQRHTELASRLEQALDDEARAGVLSLLSLLLQGHLLCSYKSTNTDS